MDIPWSTIYHDHFLKFVEKHYDTGRGARLTVHDPFSLFLSDGEIFARTDYLEIMTYGYLLYFSEYIFLSGDKFTLIDHYYIFPTTCTHLHVNTLADHG